MGVSRIIRHQDYLPEGPPAVKSLEDYHDGNIFPTMGIKKEIHLFYHVALLEKGLEILREQLDCLVKSGLGTACRNIHVTLVGGQIEKALEIIMVSELFEKMIFTCHRDPQVYEFPTLEKVIAFSRENPNALICYFHTKGASHSLGFNEGSQLTYTQENLINLQQQRCFLEYFVIENWQQCVDGLKEADVCGVDWLRDDSSSQDPYYFGSHFAGNFWWTTGKYIQRCDLNRESRYKCESFIGTGNPVVNNMFSSFECLKSIEHLNIYQFAQKNTVSHPPAFIFNFKDYFFHPSYYRKTRR